MVRLFLPFACTCAACTAASAEPTDAPKPPSDEARTEPMSMEELRAELDELEERHALLAGIIIENEQRVLADRAKLVRLSQRVWRHRQELTKREHDADSVRFRGAN